MPREIAGDRHNSVPPKLKVENGGADPLEGERESIRRIDDIAARAA